MLHAKGVGRRGFHFYNHHMSFWIGALDLGTQSTRFTIYDDKRKIIAQHQTPIRHKTPQPGWVEQNPQDILDTVNYSMESVANKLLAQELVSSLAEIPKKIRAIGLTNQRETTILWDKHTGKPLYPAILWNDTRCGEIVNRLEKLDNFKELQEKCGLPISTYFSALKIKWLLEHIESVRQSVANDACLFGTVDSWLLWNIGKERNHVTDVTNASRTMLMNIHTGKWDQELLGYFEIPSGVQLPTIKSSAEYFTTISDGIYNTVPITGCLGDQQASLLGHLCISPGQAKNTYGTGCFVLANTGTKPVISKNGLLTTIAYQLGPNADLTYALEGSINTAGSAVSWLKDNLNIISSHEELTIEANKVPDSGGMVFVPAFSGLFAPRWRSDARGVFVGLTGFINKSHICRALLESISFQTKEILDAMYQDSGVEISSLQVDGGMTSSETLLQIQADTLGVPVTPSQAEMTSLGAAIAAGLSVGVYNMDELQHSVTTRTFQPKITKEEREKRTALWNKAVDRSLNWV